MHNEHCVVGLNILLVVNVCDTPLQLIVTYMQVYGEVPMLCHVTMQCGKLSLWPSLSMRNDCTTATRFCLCSVETKILPDTAAGNSLCVLPAYKPILSEIIEKLLAKRLINSIIDKHLILYHQFEFTTICWSVNILQLSRFTKQLIQYSKYLRKNVWCIDVSQAFGKIWASGTLYKLKMNLSESLFFIIKYYIK